MGIWEHLISISLGGVLIYILYLRLSKDELFIQLSNYIKH